MFSDPATSFHPKAYLFWSTDGPSARVFVGSSNLSRSGILDGIECSAGVDDVAPLLDSFDRLWNEPRSRPLSHDWLRAYRLKWRPGRTPVPDVELEPLAQPVAPRPMQREALDALEQTRLAGHAAGLVVMATGLDKTWVAAFDTARPSFRRVLFVAHRDEILQQSRDVFRAVQPDADLGLFTGTEKHPAARVVFASVQTLARHLGAFDAEEFDYVVVDEFPRFHGFVQFEKDLCTENLLRSGRPRAVSEGHGCRRQAGCLGTSPTRRHVLGSNSRIGTLCDPLPRRDRVQFLQCPRRALQP